MSGIGRVAPDVIRIPAGISNAYLVGTRQSWTLIDCGTPGNFNKIRHTAEQHFGPGTRPDSIILTHGHFDHSGSAAELSDHFHVPVYAHRLELPYLTGQSKYPPTDPTVGGFMPHMSRLLPNKNYDLGDRVQALDIRSLPGLSGWRCFETPGHSPGHVSFFNSDHGTLLAGDAFITIDMDSFWLLVTMRKKVSRPPAYYTCDWGQAHASVVLLAGLEPRTLATGHGEPMSGTEATRQLRELAENFPAPTHGRYVDEPAITNERGIVHLPPPPPDPVPRVAAAVGVAAALGIAGAVAARKRAA